MISILFVNVTWVTWTTCAGKVYADSLQNPPIRKLCAGFWIQGSLDPDLSSVEKRLICGDPKKTKNPPNEGWRSIPLQQAKVHLTQLLQDRGYYHPKFLLSQSLEEVLVVLGQKTRVLRIDLQSDTDLSQWVNLEGKRDLKGRDLTPGLLNEVEKWVSQQLQIYSFACPKVTSTANPDTGEVQVQVQPGKQMTIWAVEEAINADSRSDGQRSKEASKDGAIPELAPGVLRRYDAFQIGQDFDPRLLSITEDRVTSLGIVESYRFRKNCSLLDAGSSENAPMGITLIPEVVLGPPRLIIAGFGVNTEGVLLAKSSWRDTRLGPWGSLVDFTIQASARIQNVQANLQAYAWPPVSRLYLNPSFQFSRRSELRYESLHGRGGLGFIKTWDRGGNQGEDTLGGSVQFGPALEFSRTLRGLGASHSVYPSLEARLNWKSHLFEYYLNQPRTGLNTTFALQWSDTRLFSDFTALRFEWSGQVLKNLGHWDPPLWILGLRWGFFGTFTEETSTSGTRLPATLFRYLGGSRDLRGFSRQELPLGDLTGGLTSLFTGVEIRLSHTLPFNIDPFFFFDLGAIGGDPLSLSAPLYWSPGVGARWDSPIGALRASFSQGIAGTSLKHLQIYFALGEEF